MRPALQAMITAIIGDSLSGASEMTSRLLQDLRAFLSNNQTVPRAEWVEFATEVRMARPGIASFYNIAREIEGLASNTAIQSWNNAITLMVERCTDQEINAPSHIASRFVNIAQGEKFLTLSYSSTVMATLLMLKSEREIEVLVAESLPMAEGRITAKKLMKNGVKVRVIPDALMGAVIDEVDCCVVGADAITPMGVFNKVGTRALSTVAMTAGKTFYVLCSELKIAPLEHVEFGRKKIEFEGLHELTQIFELTPLDLVDVVVTDQRHVSPRSLTFKQ
jgi:translation initiation factor 2B subunit (eIF-2B alpha/beta/delta family)